MQFARLAAVLSCIAAFLCAPSFGAASSTQTFSLRTLDLSTDFGTAGEVRGLVRGKVSVESFDAVRIDSKGRIVVAATAYVAGRPARLSSVYRTAVARYLPDGSLDPAFGAGIFVLPGRGYPVAVAVDSKDRVLVAGSFSALNGTPSGRRKWGLARVTADGHLDRSFGRGGIATAGMKRYFTDVFDMESSPVDDSVVVLVVDYFAEAGSVVVTRLDSRGRPVQEFGKRGVVRLEGDAEAFAIDPAGRVYLGPKRLTPSGALDVSFAAGGTLASAGGPLPAHAQIGFDAEGRIYAATGSALFRYLADGTPDPDWGEAGVSPIRLGVPYAFGHGAGAAGGIAVARTGGRVAFGSSFTSGGDNAFAIQVADASTPTELRAHFQTAVGARLHAGYGIFDVAIASDGAFAIAAGERDEEIDGIQVGVPFLFKVDLTPRDDVPLANGVVTWEGSPVVTLTPAQDGYRDVNILSAPLRVENRGAATMPAVTLTLWLSDDAEVGAGDRIVGDAQIPQLAPGASHTGFAVTPYQLFDQTFPSMQGRRLIAVLDSEDLVLETDESDGVTVSAPLE